MTDNQLDIFGNPESDPESPDPPEPPQRQANVGRFPFDDTVADGLVSSGLSRGRIGLAADLVRLQTGLTDAEARALFTAVVVTLAAQSQGSTFVPLPGRSDFLRDQIQRLLPEVVLADDQWSPQRLVDDFTDLVEDGDLDILGDEGDFKPLVTSEDRLYHQRMLLYETRLVEAVADRLARPDVDRETDELRRALDDVRTRQPPGSDGPIELNPEQQYALLTALHRPLTLITGGPGTGKTSIIVSILRMLVRLGTSPASIALAAPTGKAANRMAESIYGQLDELTDPTDRDLQLADDLEDPKTLHRLLGYSPRRDDFSHHPENPLSHRFVIVDESSMIDLFLMERLLRAISPTAQLVLLGDADQLPSVDTGAVLRDLIPEQTSTHAPWRELVDGDLIDARGDAPTADVAVRLTTSYRMREEDPAGREILTFARSIRDYDTDPSLETPDGFSPGSADDAPGFEAFPDGVRRFESTADGDDLGEFVDWWFDQIALGGEPETWRERFNHAHRLDDRGRLTDEAARRVRVLLDHWSRARMLTLTRVFETGSQRLNERLHRRTARLGHQRLDRDFDFHPGEPVMMLRNDYELDLFNGDQGVVVWGRRPDDSVVLTAVFARTDELIAIPVAELGDDLEHAFAMTVHKSQGSEFERVALVLPDEPMALLNRELLYTGLTRASKGVLIVGDNDLLETGAATANERFSAVADRLASH